MIQESKLMHGEIQKAIVGNKTIFSHHNTNKKSINLDRKIQSNNFKSDP